jgi:hypothetical protein
MTIVQVHSNQKSSRIPCRNHPADEKLLRNERTQNDPDGAGGFIPAA